MDGALFPVRCYTCNAVLAQHQAAFQAEMRRTSSLHSFFEAQRVVRMCCRRMFLGFVDIGTEQLKYGAVDLEVGPRVVLRRSVAIERTAACD